MTTFLTKFTSPLVALGWLGVATLAFFLISTMVLLGSLYNIFKTSLWLNYNIPAIIAFILYPLLLLVVGTGLYLSGYMVFMGAIKIKRRLELWAMS